MKILLIDDDRELCSLVAEYLGGEGWEIDAVHDGRSGLDEARRGAHDLVVLDVMLPELNGLDVLRSLREVSSVPVVMLTARGDEVDRIVGLELGADDYLPKPFNPRELAARIRAILRRSHGPSMDEEPTVMMVGDLVLDPGSRAVAVQGEDVDLTGIEFELLNVLVQRAGQVVPRADLSEQAIGRKASPWDRSLDVHMSNLRRKLGPLRDGAERIKTIRGVGYQYVRASRS
jgi:DNA-binding response OmpR family regulator